MLAAGLAMAADSTNGPGVAVIIMGVIFGVVQIILWIAAAISILRNRRFTGGGKFLWFVVIIGFPFLGCLGWFFLGRNAQLVKTGVAPPTHA